MTGTGRSFDDDEAAASAQRLGVAINASSKRLRAAFRTQALRWHPDRNPDPTALDRFREMREAYRILADFREKAGMENVLIASQAISCRTCSADDRHLQSITVTRLRSYLLFSRATATHEIHCRDCARRRLLTASLLSGAMGSWSLTGVPLAIAAAGSNARALRSNGSIDLRLALRQATSGTKAADAVTRPDRLFGVANLIAALASPAIVAAYLIYRFG